MQHSVFIANRGGSGGTVSTAYFPLTFFGENTFIDNIGPGLQVFKNSHVVMPCLSLRLWVHLLVLMAPSASLEMMLSMSMVVHSICSHLVSCD